MHSANSAPPTPQALPPQTQSGSHWLVFEMNAAVSVVVVVVGGLWVWLRSWMGPGGGGGGGCWGALGTRLYLYRLMVGLWYMHM